MMHAEVALKLNVSRKEPLCMFDTDQDFAEGLSKVPSSASESPYRIYFIQPKLKDAKSK